MVAENLRAVLATIPEGVELVAVSKFHPVEELKEAYDAGQRLFGESRVQELAAKVPALPADIRWHFIGHLQTNKVRQLIALRPALIESVDSERLLDAIDAEARRAGITAKVLLQVHVAQEETKFGFAPDELLSLLRGGLLEGLTNTHVCGLMAMATNTDSRAIVEADFARARRCFDDIRSSVPGIRGFDILSMGMSDDRQIAIAQGSNMVRVGTAIFGPRNY